VLEYYSTTSNKKQGEEENFFSTEFWPFFSKTKQLSVLWYKYPAKLSTVASLYKKATVILGVTTGRIWYTVI